MKGNKENTNVARTGARCVIEGLEKIGCKVLFGYPGGSIIDVFDELIKSDSIQLVLPRHEQGGVHMADGYARATGEVGFCMVTSGPGVTNTVTGLATANMDGIPLVCISGQVSTTIIGNDGFQEADTCGITRSVTKHNFLVRDVNDLPRVIIEAYHIAKTGKPGPVLIDVPKDVQRSKTSVPFPAGFERPGYKPSYEGHPRMIAKLASLLNTCNKPLLYVGGGVISSNTSDLVKELAYKAEIPVTTTMMGLGAFPETDDLSLCMLGMHGLIASNKALNDCDLLISVGARFDDRVTGKISAFAPHAKIAHIDIDPSAIGKSVRCDIPLVGHLEPVLKELIQQVHQTKHTEWVEMCKKWKEEDPFCYEPSKEGHIKPQYVIEQVDAVSKGKALVCTDVGQNQLFSTQFFRHNTPRNFISSGGLGTMGFGLPATIGAQIGCPDKLCVCISGDGGMQMNAQEIVVAVEHKLPINIIILNNGYLGNVRQWQDMFYNRVHSATVLTQNNRPKNEHIVCEEENPKYLPDFIMLAKAHGAEAKRILKVEDVAPALKEAFESPKTWVLEFIVEREENVMPMIPPGGTVDETIRSFS